MRKMVLIFVSLFFVSGCASTTNPQLAPQMKSTQDYFLSVPFTALVNFHVHGNHFVDSNGKPLEGKSQSKRIGSKGLFTKTYAVAKGEKGYLLIGQKSDRVLMALVSTEKGGLGAAWNPSNIEIHFPRPITEQDITPKSIAHSLSSLLVFKDFKPGSELDDLLDELDKPLD